MPAYGYLEYLNMARTCYGLGAGASGAGVGNDMSFGQTVGGGLALCVGAPLALKTGKAVLWDAPKWAYQNFGDYRGGFGNLLQNYRNKKAFYAQEQQMLKGNNKFQTVKNRFYWNELNSLNGKIPTDVHTSFNKSEYFKLKAEDPQKAADYLKKFQDQKSMKTAKADCYKAAKAKIAQIKADVKAGKLKGANLRKAVQEAEKLITDGDAQVQKLIESGKIKPTSRLGKIGAGLKKYTGVNAMNKALTKGAQSSSKVVSTASKGVKGFVKGGGALTAAIEFAFETPEIIETYKTLGTGAGLRQAGKAATVAVASGVGYAAGAWAGGKIGAATGAAIGSFVPVVGTVVGSVVGSIIGIGCGLAASWAAGTAVKDWLGPSELKKAANKNAIQTAQAALESPEKAEELLAAYDQVINQREELVQEGYDQTAVETSEEMNILNSLV